MVTVYQVELERAKGMVLAHQERVQEKAPGSDWGKVQDAGSGQAHQTL